jgi:CheY-like chemotaxis protein
MWKVLVVDDEPMNRKLLIEILGDKAQCETANDGKEALDAFRASLKGEPFDIILLDISMPDMDGVEVLRIIRELEETKDVRLGTGIPVIMVTAYTAPFMSSFKEGADDYILKPVDPDQLIAKVEKLLALRETAG